KYPSNLMVFNYTLLKIVITKLGIPLKNHNLCRGFLLLVLFVKITRARHEYDACASGGELPRFQIINRV
ncbi:hypothetical protein, partial [Tenacibaculum maritimum]|uniref:hypothetical protein n=1 Tax=Tenacibaculum maritimum TaxID=107401 RepID=UPI001F1D020D